jgi:hypothetical protein
MTPGTVPQFDTSGFYTREWASMNIAGFDDLDPCCQQLTLLFPSIGNPCLLAPEKPVVTFKYPTHPDVPGAPQVYPQALSGAAGGYLLGYAGSGNTADIPHAQVPEPATGFLLLIFVLVTAVYRTIESLDLVGGMVRRGEV